MKNLPTLIRKRLHCKALSATASSGGIRIVKIKTLAIQPSGEFQGRVEKIEETLQVRHDFQAVIFENLIVGLTGIVEIHLIRQP